MKRYSLLLVGAFAMSMAACTPSDNSGDQQSSQAASSSEDNIVQETKNVMYRGMLDEAGVSIFMQGTHRLTLDDGRFVMLESESVNLDRYVDQNVEVFGSVRPTVEEGGMIMRVESVRSLKSSSSSSAMNSESNASSDSSSSTTSTAASSAVTSAVEQSSSFAASSAADTSSMAAWQASDELSAKASLMAKDKMTADLWTQQYCSTHIGYCFPVHKNWWFKSFGTTSSVLWHVEIGPSEMNNLGEGPISVDVVSGDIAATGMADNQVRIENGTAVGARSWTGNRHIEVHGPASLEAAIRYITEQLKPAQ